MNFWFGFSRANKGVVEEAKHGFVVLACGSRERLLLFHAQEFLPFLEWMDQTAGRHWHVHVTEKDGTLLLNQPRKNVKTDVTEYLIPTNVETGAVERR